ncbi:MAG: hypothetical protein A3G23_07390 [Bacteroidetes bacterium RIFCSPLOWO2_12_FULL_37_12]|nr:MAG: hypothetical protein A3G23_07390 [Bacteroidetes bacterium RIFCSPLOWO2_12_FULL_37_12]
MYLCCTISKIKDVRKKIIKFYYILLYLAFFCFTDLSAKVNYPAKDFSQDNTTSKSIKIDSLEQELKISKLDSIRTKLLFQLGLEYKVLLPSKSIIYSEQALLLVKKTKQVLLTADILKLLGFQYTTIGNYNQAISYYSDAIHIYKKFNKKNDEGDCIHNTGQVYLNKGDLKKALSEFRKALRIYEEADYPYGIAKTYQNIGILYRHLDNNDKALEYYFKAIAIWERVDNKQEKANCLNSVGIVYIRKKNYNKSLECFTTSLEIQKELNNKKGIASILANLGIITDAKGDFKKSLEYFEKSLAISNEIQDKWGVSAALNSIGIEYNLLKDFKKAKEYSHRGLAIATEIDAKENIKNSYYNLFETYRNSGDMKNSYQYLVLYSKIKDSLFNEEKNRQIGKMEENYEIDKKIRLEKEKAEKIEKQIQKEKKRRTDIQYYALTVFIVVLLVLVIITLKSQINIRVTTGVIFLTFLILYEFLLILLDPALEKISTGEPIVKLLFNVLIALSIFPIHRWIEKKITLKLIEQRNPPINYNLPILFLIIILNSAFSGTNLNSENTMDNSFTTTDSIPKKNSVTLLIDSLQLALKTCTNDSLKATILMKLVDTNYDTQTWPALNQQALEISEKQIPLSKGKTLEYYLNIKGRALYYKGFEMDYTGISEKALYYYYQSLKLLEKTGDYENRNTVMNSIGALYYQQNMTSKAISIFKDCMELNIKNKDRVGESNTLLWLGFNYYKRGELDTSANYLIKCLSKLSKDEANEIHVSALQQLGAIYRSKKDYQLSAHYFRRGYEISKILGDERGMMLYFSNTGTLFKINGFNDSALFYFKRAEKIAYKLNQPDLIKGISLELSQFYNETENYANAEEYYLLYMKMKDSLMNESKSQEIGKLEARFESEKKLEEEYRQKLEKDADDAATRFRKNNLQYSAICICLILFFLIPFYLRRKTTHLHFLPVLIFISFLIFFEFLQMLTDPIMDKLTQNEPAYKLLVNLALAFAISPLHNFLENKFRKRLLKNK